MAWKFLLSTFSIFHTRTGNFWAFTGFFYFYAGKRIDLHERRKCKSGN
jgi:hypothetical protein